MPTRGVLLQSLLLAVLVTWPALLDPAGAVLGSPSGDALKHVWNLWWMHAELTEGDWGLHTSFVNYPTGIDLYPIEFANGLLTAWTPLPPVLAANVLAYVHVVLIGVCTGWLGWLVARRPASAFVAGALAQGGAFTAFTLHVGVGELRQAWWVPLGLGFAIRARDLLRPKDFVALGIVLGAATLACFYHGFFLATAVAVYALSTLARDRRLWLGWAVAVVLGLGMVLPTVKLFASTYGTATRPDVSFFEWMRGPLPTASSLVDSLDLPEIVQPDLTLVSDPSGHFEAYLGGRYLGVIALILAGIGVASAPRRAWPWVAIALAGVVLALGNTLWWGGAQVEPTIYLPLAVINKALAWVAEPLNFPVRYLAITSTALAVLGGLAARWRWTLLLVPLVLVDVAWNDPVPFPRATFTLDGAPDLVAPPGAVADMTWATRADTIAENQDPLTLFDQTMRKQDIAAQIYLNRPMQTVAIERVDHWAYDGIYWTAASPLARALAGTPVEPSYLKAGMFLLHERGFASVLLSHACDGEQDGRAVRMITEVLGPPVSGACADLWALPTGPPPADLATYAAQQEADLAHVPPPTLGTITEVTRPKPDAVPPPPGG